MDHYNILFFTSSLRTGGAEHHILNLCRWLRSAGHECAVCTISPAEDGLETAFLEDGIPLYRMPLGSLRALPSPRVVSGLRTIARDFRPGLIHAHLFHAEVAAAFAGALVRVPVVVTRHSAGLEFRGWHALAARMLAPRCAACIAVSGGAADEALRMGHPRERITVIPNAVDPARFHPVEENERERGRSALIADLFRGGPARPLVLVGSAGRLTPVKNFPLMLRVAAKLAAGADSRPGAPEIRFVIFGEGSERESLVDLSRDLGIEPLVSLPGRRDNLEEVYPLLDAFLLPSWSEGVPMALLEAMSSGVACVASDVGGVGEVLAEAGVLARPGDEDAFAESLQDLVLHIDRRKELGRRARVRVLEKYNVDIWGERILAVYRSVLDGGPGR
ncbi:MAG: glycosyltransferase family 4 protein [Candidatus Krumholzibacteriaceae bacterium]